MRSPGRSSTILGVVHILDVTLPVTTLFAIIAVELLSNIACVVAARRAVRVAEWWSGAVMVLDVVLLTALLHFAGGPFNPFSFLYLVEIALAAVIVRARWTWALVIVSLVGSGALFVGQPTMLVSHGGDHMELHLRGMWVAFGVAASFIVYFLLRVRRDLETREAELADAQRRVDRQERLASLATLAAGAAHELATPLGTIALAASELERHLQKVQADAASLEDVHLIRAQVDRCRSILDSMAADAGESAGEQPARRRASAELLRARRRRPARRAAHRRRRRQRRRAVRARAAARGGPGAASRWSRTRRTRRRAERPVSLRADVRGNRVAIEVVDRGAGMPPGGAGARRRAVLHDQGAGARHGPRPVPHAHARRAARRRADAVVGGGRRHARARAAADRMSAGGEDIGVSILLVDDDEVFRKRLGRAFFDRGHDVRLAANYDEALASAREDSPQFAVVDLKMPGRSGLDVVRDLKAVDPTTRIVVLTGYGSIATAVDAVKLGATHYLPKPADADEILAALTREEGDASPAAQEFPAPSLARAEWEHIQRVLSDAGGNISEAARRLGMHRRSLQLKLRKHPPSK